MATANFLETRWLKRQKLGPPDVYPQDPKQKEDELTSVNVKQGFINPTLFNDEYSSAHSYNIDSNKISQSFSHLLTQKQIFNTYNDAAKRRPQVGKENFYLVPVINPKVRNHLQNWFKDLSSSKSLSLLSKRVPVFSKKEDIFQSLAEYDVPLVRSTWFIKMSAAYHLTQTDVKNKKRAANDPNSDWTQAICKFMREQLTKLNEGNAFAKTNGTLSQHISLLPGSVGSGTVAYLNPPTVIARDDFEKQSQYISNLAHHMYSEDLLDKHEFLTWLVEEFELIPLYDEIALSYFMPFVLQYIEEVVKNQLLARRMCFTAAHHLNWIFLDNYSLRSDSPSMQSGLHASNLSQSAQNGIYPAQQQLQQQCPAHLHSIAHTLASVIQCTTLSCPGALVWYPPVDPRTCGSPMDLLPCAPSALLLPDLDKNDEVGHHEDTTTRNVLYEKEVEIVQRSTAAELRWSSAKCQESNAGHTINRVLTSLEALDKHRFSHRDSLMSLYHKIFDQTLGKDLDMQVSKSSEEAVIGLLCEWAITAKRLGEHRAAVVAKLLDLRQAFYEREQQPTGANINESTSSNSSQQPGSAPDMSSFMETSVSQNQASRPMPRFQSLLFTFLDTQAPELNDPNNAEQLQEFKNLVLLFSELIEHDVFAYDQYLNMLISRGDICPGQIASLPSYAVPTPQSDLNLSSNSNLDRSISSNPGMLSSGLLENRHLDGLRMDGSHDPSNSMLMVHSSKMDPSEHEFLPGHDSMFNPDQRSDRHFLDAVRPIDKKSNSSKVTAGNGLSNSSSSLTQLGSLWGYHQPRHVQYIMHFPLPYQDDDITYEWNQRLVALYGAGRQKTFVKKAVRKITRHLIKLIQNKRGVDEKDYIQPVSWGPPGKKGKVKSTSSHAELLSRYRALSYFDQHMVTAHVAKALLACLGNYTSGRSMILPNLNVVMLLFDLMQEALNISGMVQTAVSICTALASLSSAIKQKKHDMKSFKTTDAWYCTELSHIVVAIVWNYQSYLNLYTDLTVEAFDGFFSLAKESFLYSPAQCTSSDRIILTFMYEIYCLLSVKSHTPLSESLAAFGNYALPVKQTLFNTKKPAASNYRYDTTFMRDFLENPDAESPLSVAECYGDKLRDMTCRYSFVCTAIISVCCGQQNLKKVNALASFCAEMNARCNELSAEWLGVLKALCSSSSCATSSFNDVLLNVDASDAQIRNPLALFTAVLIARGCLSFSDVIKHVAIPSLLRRCQSNASTLDTGARLTCHLLLQLFKAPNATNTSNTKYSFYLPSSSDRHLLATAQHNIEVGAVVAVLKSVLKLGDTSRSSERNIYKLDGDDNDGVTSFLAPIHDFDDFDIRMDTNTIDHSVDKNQNSLDGASLSEFAKHTLRVICAQQWVRERCLKESFLDHLMDQILTREQRQNLIQLILYPEEDVKQRLSSLSGDPRSYVVDILASMTRWTLRQRMLELQAMLHESPQEKSLPEHIAKATIEVFQQQQFMEATRERKYLTGPELDRCNVWLVAPLVSKLSTQVQGRVLQEASDILEARKNWPTSSTRSAVNVRADHDGEQHCSGSSLLNHQPFLTLILTCLNSLKAKDQDEQRDSLLESLQSQIVMLHTEWHSAWNQRDIGKDMPLLSSSQNGVHDALQLRLSLVGGMFDTVQSNSQWTSDVVVLLTTLINSGMVDVQINADLFNTVYDMIAVLLHHTLGGDEPSRAEGSKREYMNIVKKMKKEIGENQTESIKQLRQLLPIHRTDVYIVCCEPIGPLMDVKGNKVPVPVDGNHGLQVASKQKLNVWEIIEGLKNPAPLCLAWFGARKTERKVLFYEQEQALLLYHEHGNKRSLDEFLKPPQLPPEEEIIAKTPPPPKTSERKTSISKIAASGSGTNTSTQNEMKRPPVKNPRKRPSRSRSKGPEPPLGPAFSRPITNTPGLSGPGNPAGNIINQMAQVQTSNFTGFTTPNPPSYVSFQQHTNLANPFPASGFSAQQRNLTATPAKEALVNHVRNRIANNAFNDTRIRQRAEPVKTGVHKVYNLQQRQGIPRQHIVNQPQSNQSYTTYGHQQNQQTGMVQNYNQSIYRNTNAPSGPMGYQHTNVGGRQPNPQYISQQQRQLRNPSYNIQQTYAGQQQQQQQQQMMGMQTQQAQQQTQYGMNQLQNRSAQLNRLGQQQMGVHQINSSQTIQGGGMGQRQMIDHQQMMNTPQYGQQMQTNQQQASGMMGMRQNMIQPPQY
ncbi:mediator of RNA polymerase II transcription subunit 12-like protein [Clavelina lepadiformis]|uniref:mediator of RNA polymerase II transcription subunit 12-like protein n=1 Tax=Clavelina lepadiformis TaxID=159417 RepID=UPI004042C59F